MNWSLKSFEQLDVNELYELLTLRSRVFVVEQTKDRRGKQLRQQFVRLGEKRGDFVAVTAGLKGGETLVSTGVFKLRNGQAVVVDNRLAPRFSSAPRPENN